MRKKIIALVFSAALFALCSSAEAQQTKKVPRIGFLVNGSPSSYSTRIEAFRQGLHELSYVEGQNILVDYRYAEGKANRFPELATELLRLKPDVLVTSGSPAIRALMSATRTIPIVMAAVGDAVGAGFAQNLSRPGGNLTGLSFLDTDISTKRLELLKEALPRVSRVAVLRHPDNPNMSLDPTLTAALPLKLQVQILDVQGPADFDAALVVAKKSGAQAIIVLSSPFLFSHRKALVDLAAKHQLPGMYENKDFVDAGGLMSYGASFDDMFRRAATYVDKILKGAKPAELPVEQPTKFELVINLKTAKQIGLTIPPNMLVRADRVIR